MKFLPHIHQPLYTPLLHRRAHNYDKIIKEYPEILRKAQIQRPAKTKVLHYIVTKRLSIIERPKLPSFEKHIQFLKMIFNDKYTRGVRLSESRVGNFGLCRQILAGQIPREARNFPKKVCSCNF